MFFKSDPLPETADFIVLISFAATSKRLTNGSRLTLELAKKMADRYPNAPVIGGTYFDNPEPDIELQEKNLILRERFICIGPVTSTTDEYDGIELTLQEKKFEVGNIIVIDEAYHSIRTRIVWRHYLSDSDINLSFQLVPGYLAADLENPMPLQRSSPKWLLANLAAAPFYKWWPGVQWFATRNFNQAFKK